MLFRLTSRLALSTLSGSPVTSNTGSLSRLGVTMYVFVACWIRFIVEPEYIYIHFEIFTNVLLKLMIILKHF